MSSLWNQTSSVVARHGSSRGSRIQISMQYSELKAPFAVAGIEMSQYARAGASSFG